MPPAVSVAAVARRNAASALTATDAGALGINRDTWRVTMLLERAELGVNRGVLTWS
jgi:hypothetical protein